MATTIDSAALAELNSAEARALFDTADKLSSLGVGRIVDLPQIIVVGDQSAGKSSVLEAISGVHFPIDGGVCTRFATELVLRPSTRSSIAATVHFADGTSPSQSVRTADFDQNDISSIIQDAKHKMGLSATGAGFSKGVLRLEIEGPGLYPLTLVDLPGIFHAGTADQSIEGKATVMELVESYMKKPSSIILAIISANAALVMQAVLQLATKHDPTKARTLGVVTKPDLLPTGSSPETEYLELVRGRNPVYKLSLGWHVLRNRADYETDLGSRETIEEDFFKSGPWASIPQTNRGLTSLRTRLSRILFDHLKMGLPALIENLQEKLSERQLELTRLGRPRSSPEDMRSYLIEIASGFERLVHDGIQGRYNNTLYHGTKGASLRLRAQLRNFNKSLRTVSLEFGCSQQIIGRPGWIDPETPEIPDYLEEFMEMHQYRDGLDDPKEITWEDINLWLEQQAASHQGIEFPGYANMGIVMRLFQSQAKPWKLIAERHLQKVLGVTKAFVEAVFEDIVGPLSSNSTTKAILITLVDDYFDAKEQALAVKLKELLRPYHDGYAMPLDADFHEAMRLRVAKYGFLGDDASDTSKASDDDGFAETSCEFGTERIIDTVQTFYDMALRTFVDNVINLAVESCLVQDLPNIFTPRQVSNMDKNKLEQLAAEPAEVHDLRLRLKQDIQLLQEGLERCRPYKPRARLAAQAPSHTRATGGVSRSSSQTPSSTAKPPPKSTSLNLSNAAATSSTPESLERPSGASLFGSSVLSPSSAPSSKTQDGQPKNIFGHLYTGEESATSSSRSGPFFSASSSAAPSKKTDQPGKLFGSTYSSSTAGETSTSTSSPFGSLNKSTQPVSKGVFGSGTSGASPQGSNAATSGGGLFSQPSQASSATFASGLFGNNRSDSLESSTATISNPPRSGASST